MTKQDKDSNILAWSLIGGIVGVGAITLFLALRREKEVPFNTIGETIAQIGSVLQNNHIDEPAPVKNFEKNLRKNENIIGDVVGWIATGINLWKKFKN